MTNGYCGVDLNEAEIVAAGGLQPIVANAGMAAEFMSPAGSKGYSSSRTAKQVEQHEELAAQCSR